MSVGPDQCSLVLVGQTVLQEMFHRHKSCVCGTMLMFSGPSRSDSLAGDVSLSQDLCLWDQANILWSWYVRQSCGKCFIITGPVSVGPVW